MTSVIETPVKHLMGNLIEGGFFSSKETKKSCDKVLTYLSPFLYKFDFPPGGFDDLKAIGETVYWQNTANHLLLQSGLDQAATNLSNGGIQAVVLKGMVLVERLYRIIGLRTVADIDLLVRRRDFVKAVEILEASGWKRYDLENTLDLEAIADGIPWTLAQTTFQDENGCHLDLHFHLLPYTWHRMLYKLDMDAFWEEVQPIPKDKLKGMWDLSPAHTLIHLCLHLAQHGFNSIRHFLDIDLFVRFYSNRPDWDWGKVIRPCQSWSIKSCCYHALEFSRSLFGTPLPEFILKDIDPGVLAKRRMRSILKPEDLLLDHGVSLGRRYAVLAKAGLTDKVSDLAATAVKLIFPSPGWRRWRYNGKTSLLRHWKHVFNVSMRDF
jgi:hypothetical protein